MERGDVLSAVWVAELKHGAGWWTVDRAHQARVHILCWRRKGGPRRLGLNGVRLRRASE